MRHWSVSSAIAVLLCFFTFAAVGAYADTTQTWVLTGSNGSPPCSASSPCAEVTIDINSTGTKATFTVTSLVNNYVFDTFGFNESGGPALTLFSSSGDVNTSGNHYGLGGSGNEDGWGSFAYNFDTGLSGGSIGSQCAVTGGVPSAGCTFSFTVSGTGLTLADFEISSSGGTGSGFFAGHEANGTQLTGYVGNPQPPTGVPEPSSLGMLFSGFLVIGSFGRRFLKYLNV